MATHIMAYHQSVENLCGPRLCFLYSHELCFFYDCQNHMLECSYSATLGGYNCKWIKYYNMCGMNKNFMIKHCRDWMSFYNAGGSLQKFSIKKYCNGKIQLLKLLTS